MQGLAMPAPTATGRRGCRCGLRPAPRDDKREWPAGRNAMATDLEIARAATLLPIGEIAARAGIPDEALVPFGRYKAKIEFGFLGAQAAKATGGKLVLVTGISPTAA